MIAWVSVSPQVYDTIRELDYSLVREMFISPDSMYVLVEFITNTKPVVYELEYDF